MKDFSGRVETPAITTDATSRKDDTVTIPRELFEKLCEDADNWRAYRRTWLPEGIPFGSARVPNLHEGEFVTSDGFVYQK